MAAHRIRTLKAGADTASSRGRPEAASRQGAPPLLEILRLNGSRVGGRWPSDRRIRDRGPLGRGRDGHGLQGPPGLSRPPRCPQGHSRRTPSGPGGSRPIPARGSLWRAHVRHWNEMSARWHQDYERGRPSYPPEVVGVAGLPTSATVLEVGAGTGKLTRLLVAEFARVVAVEPDPDMRRWFASLCPQAMLLGGTAEHIPLADGSLDAVFAAEAFHWFAHESALAEIARVLRPRGALVLMWNLPTGPIEPPIAAVEQLLEPHWPEDIDMPLDLDPFRLPHARDWPRAFERSMFEALEETRFANPLAVDRDGLVAFFGSMGWIGGLPDEERLALLSQIKSRLTAREYRLPFETHVHCTTLRRLTRGRLPDGPRPEPLELVGLVDEMRGLRPCAWRADRAGPSPSTGGGSRAPGHGPHGVSNTSSSSGATSGGPGGEVSCFRCGGGTSPCL